MDKSTRIRFDIAIGRFRFAPGLVPTLATLVLLPGLMALGFWQLDRAEQKRRLQDDFDHKQSAAPVELDGDLADPERIRYRRVRIRGRYDPEYQFLLDNRVHDGRVGYHVLTPIRIRNSTTRVLINRGWIPIGSDRDHLPRVDSPAGEVVVDGVATVPHGREFRLGPVKPDGPDWQPRWQYLDLTVYAQSVPFPVQPVVILLDSGSPAGGFERRWGRLDTGIQTHLGYAMTWFSLAGALLAIYIIVNVRRTADAGRKQRK